MSDELQPLTKFESGGRASILNYNVPDSTSYSGQGYIDLNIDSDWFITESDDRQTFPDWIGDRYDIGSKEFDDISIEDDQYRDYRRIREAIKENKAFKRVKEDLEKKLDVEEGISGMPIVSSNDPIEMTALEMSRELNKKEPRDKGSIFATPLMLRTMKGTTTEKEEQDEIADMFQQISSEEEPAFDPTLIKSLQPQSMASDILNNKIPLIYTGFTGVPTYEPIPAPQEKEPRLMLVEEYSVSTYLGDYGAGRTLKTFSLLPGEETTINIKTFRQEKTKRKETQNILESKTKSAAKSFEKEISKEQWNKEEYQQSKAYTKKRNINSSTEGGVGINLGIVKADTGGERSRSASETSKGSSKLARSSFAKNTMNAVSESSSKASSKREVEVNTSQETTTETRREKSVDRVIENINLSRTLNFVFRQLNQEFITIFHLENVRVAYSDGTVDTDPSGKNIDGLNYREVPLWKLDELLSDVIEEEHRQDVKDHIKQELQNIIGYDGETYSIVEEDEIAGQPYLHIDKGEPHEYTDPRVDPDVEEDQQPIRVPGVILEVDRNTMRTDGVIVEALLGKGEALDAYSQGLQSAEVRSEQLKNAEKQARVKRQKLARKLVENGDEDEVERYNKLFGLDEEQFEVDLDIGADSHENDNPN